METKDWKAKETAKVLLIGHDPRLNKSHTIAETALFANYYFKPIPTKSSEKKKYGLAKSSFEYIVGITNGKYKPENIYITNLCNTALEHAPIGKTVLIPQSEAEKGLKNIKSILKENPSIEYIFPMSLQVNYWLQKLSFYNTSDNFIKDSEPVQIGLNNNPPYFKAKVPGTFLSICGNQYKVNNGNQTLIPILHVKTYKYPFTNNFISYNQCYEKLFKYFKSV